MYDMKQPSLFQNVVALAPMAGVADSSFRSICMEYGASFSVGEMISTKAICFGNKNTLSLLYHRQKEKPFGVQLFGNDPKDFIKASKIVYDEASPDFIDINMGCPAPKIVKTGAGSALMGHPSLAGDILKAVKDTVPVPVTAKIRSGLTEETKNAVSFAKVLENAGADAITIHGRTRERMYKPPVDLGIIKEVVNALSIPVIGNGDIFCYTDYINMVETTGCAGVMIGRGSLGNPFIFSEILSKGEIQPPPLSERLNVLKAQTMLALEEKGETLALIEARKHAAWYTKGIRGASTIRTKAFNLLTLEDLDSFISYVRGYQ